MSELVTARLRLRAWTQADLGALHRLWSDPQTIWWGSHQTLEQTRALFEKVQQQGGWWAEAPVVPENTRSQQVVKKLGFAIEGQLMHGGRLHALWVR